MKCLLVTLLTLNAVICSTAQREVRPSSDSKFDKNKIEWSGMTWLIKDRMPENVIPGPNYFTKDMIEVDSNGSLTLSIKQMADGKWGTAEIYSTIPLVHGTYAWIIESDLDSLDSQIELDLFKKVELTIPDNRFSLDWSILDHVELGIDISRFGYPEKPLQGAFLSWLGRHFRFEVPTGSVKTFAEFTWSSCGLHYILEKNGQTINHTEKVHIESTQEPVHMNFWLREGQPPLNGKPASVTIESFKYTPISEVSSDKIVPC